MKARDVTPSTETIAHSTVFHTERLLTHARTHARHAGAHPVATGGKGFVGLIDSKDTELITLKHVPVLEVGWKYLRNYFFQSCGLNPGP